MPSNYKTLNPDYDSEDPASSQYIDLDDRFIDDAWILERFVGNNLFAWGDNTSYGQLGLGDTTDRSSPVQVGSLTDWSLISNGNRSTLAIKRNGTLWGWGENGTGELGLSDRTIRTSPVQVGSLTNWKQVSCGVYHTLSVKTDGTLWAWGYNYDHGPLGLNDRTSYSSPVQVGALTNWKQVSCGWFHTAAVKADGTLWTWGNGANGRLGLNETTHRSSPVQVGSLTNWKQVSCGASFTLAAKTDGTLWSWGYGNYGELGLNNTSIYSSPVQVGTLTNWKLVSCGDYATAAIKTDGTLWMFGKNSVGALGLGDTTNRSSPVQVGSLTNWKQVDTAGYTDGFTTAIKTDGTLWTWGRNVYGELGQNNITHRSSPVQVGSLTNWKQVSCGLRGIHTSAITYTEIS